MFIVGGRTVEIYPHRLNHFSHIPFITRDRCLYSIVGEVFVLDTPAVEIVRPGQLARAAIEIFIAPWTWARSLDDQPGMSLCKPEKQLCYAGRPGPKAHRLLFQVVGLWLTRRTFAQDLLQR